MKRDHLRFAAQMAIDSHTLPGGEFFRKYASEANGNKPDAIYELQQALKQDKRRK